jgi:hypothetical protein
MVKPDILVVRLGSEVSLRFSLNTFLQLTTLKTLFLCARHLSYSSRHSIRVKNARSHGRYWPESEWQSIQEDENKLPPKRPHRLSNFYSVWVNKWQPRNTRYFCTRFLPVPTGEPGPIAKPINEQWILE